MSKVYFIRNITKENVVKIYEKLGIDLPQKVAVKVHSGEHGNQNYLRPEFLVPIVNKVNGTIVECNTAYPGERDTTEKHIKLMESHEWSKYFNVDIMDSEGDITLDIPNGKTIHKNYVGKNILNYNSMLVISHFKGHPMGGYGGALKQLSIGCASSKGKRYIHCVGKENGSYEDMFTVNQNDFLSSMADSASSITDMFKDNILYINIMCNMSVDCDCSSTAKKPCMKDIGILASNDPVSIDKACLDLVYSSDDPGKDELIERIESRNGSYVIECAYNLGLGDINYELVEVNNE